MDTPERVTYSKLRASTQTTLQRLYIEQFQFSIDSDYESEQLESPPRKKSQAAAVYQTLTVYILMIFIDINHEYLLSHYASLLQVERYAL